MVQVAVALHLLLPRYGELMASWPVVYGREDVLQREGREDDLDEAPRERKNNNYYYNNKIHMKINTFARTEGYDFSINLPNIRVQ